MLKEFFVETLIQKITIKLFSFLWCSLLCLFFLWNNAVAEEEVKKVDPKPEIHVSADKLISDRNAKYAEFIGNVVAVRGSATLTCNKLKVFYLEKEEKSKKNEQSGAIDKMVASENVKLKFEDKIAVAEKAVYTAVDDSIVLTGGNPKVTSGNSYVSGDKITLYRTDGKIIVDRGKTERVNAKFHPQDAELMKKKND